MDKAIEKLLKRIEEMQAEIDAAKASNATEAEAARVALEAADDALEQAKIYGSASEYAEAKAKQQAAEAEVEYYTARAENSELIKAPYSAEAVKIHTALMDYLNKKNAEVKKLVIKNMGAILEAAADYEAHRSAINSAIFALDRNVSRVDPENAGLAAAHSASGFSEQLYDSNITKGQDDISNMGRANNPYHGLVERCKA